MKKFHNLNAIIIAVIVIILDQLSKYLFKLYISVDQSIPIIKNIFHLTLVHNTGAGFGILQDARIFLIIFSLGVLIGIIWKWDKIPKEKSASIPLGLILGGLAGNLIDRCLLGYVIDFLDFRIWPVFNIADSCITIAVVWLVIYLWKK